VSSWAEPVFWAALALVAYGYAGYAAVVWGCARLFGRRDEPPAVPDAELPRLTLLIAAHNEAAVIGERIENALALDYPRDRLEILVASDGSTDATAGIVRGFAGRGVRLLDYQPNRGKAATLNAAWREATGDVVLLSDANTFTDRAAARRLARWFRDPSVGAVCGRLILVDPVTGRNVDGLYWRYETFLKACEARLGALLGANGAIYAVRRDRYVPIPPETIIDDFVIPLLGTLTHGTRLVYDADAVAREDTPPEIADEFKRRARIGAGGFQSLRLLWPLLSPARGWLAFSFVSHKLVRWACPFFLLAMAAANVALVAQPFYRATLAMQAGFYALAWLGGRSTGQGPLARALRLATLFSSMNAALLVGFYRWLTGRQRGAWARTARAEVAGEAAGRTSRVA
jgi:cellulose synthase/poly-beta-1,6-N-acetylglucosamine synthase-like glycosyltransferase